MADLTDPQHQKCDLCEQMTRCVQVSVTTGGRPELFTVAESYWICVLCGDRPITDLVERAFKTRDDRPQLPSYPGEAAR